MDKLEMLVDQVCKDKVTVRDPYDLSDYQGKTVAFDATNGLEPFLDEIRKQTPDWISNYRVINTHLIGALVTTVRLIENNINPVYVFSGNPSPLRKEFLWETYKRQRLNELTPVEELNKYNMVFRRINFIGKKHERHCQELFKLLGIPFIVAPGEAGAQCAEMIRSQKVYASISQDLNALTFGSEVLLRNISYPPLHELPVKELHLHLILEALQLKQPQLVELAIVLGCDYFEGIRGVTPTQALKMVQQHKNIENILQFENTPGNRLQVPENWNYLEIRDMFTNPIVADSSNLQTERTQPSMDDVVRYLVNKQCYKSGVQNILRRVW